MVKVKISRNRMPNFGEGLQIMFIAIKNFGDDDLLKNVCVNRKLIPVYAEHAARYVEHAAR